MYFITLTEFSNERHQFLVNMATVKCMHPNIDVPCTVIEFVNGTKELVAENIDEIYGLLTSL